MTEVGSYWKVCSGGVVNIDRAEKRTFLTGVMAVVSMVLDVGCVYGKHNFDFVIIRKTI